jgi:xanthine dehydrogenase accessory factor
MKREVLVALNQAIGNGRAVVRAVDIASGDERVIDPAADSTALGTAAAKAARADQSGAVEIDGHTWFLTVYNPPLDLAVVGAVHIAQPLCAMAQLAGYQVRVIDPRTAFATTERFPNVAISHDWPDEALAKAPLGPRSALVALTHDPKMDDPALTTALKFDCFYIGALGSKKNHAARRERLKQHGFSDGELDRIHGPIGLAIGARSPAEIAVAILAEITQRLRTDAGSELGTRARDLAPSV